MKVEILYQNAQLLWNYSRESEPFEVDATGKLYLLSHWRVWKRLRPYLSGGDPLKNSKAVETVYNTLSEINRLLESEKRPLYTTDNRLGYNWENFPANFNAYSDHYPVYLLAERIIAHPQFCSVSQIAQIAGKIKTHQALYPQTVRASSNPERDPRRDPRIVCFDEADHGFFPEE